LELIVRTGTMAGTIIANFPTEVDLSSADKADEADEANGTKRVQQGLYRVDRLNRLAP
jgi:hypothetical protein